MIAEMLSSACFLLLVVVICCMMKIYNMVKVIRPSGNERARVAFAGENQRALAAEREPTGYFLRAEGSAEQRSPCYINTIYQEYGAQRIRRYPQIHDERFKWQTFYKLLASLWWTDVSRESRCRHRKGRKEGRTTRHFCILYLMTVCSVSVLGYTLHCCVVNVKYLYSM